MKEEGCPDPVFELGTESLACILPAHPRHILIKELYNIEQAIILGKHAQAADKLLGILRLDPDNFRAIDLLCEVCLLLDKPKILTNFLTEGKINLERVNASTLIKIIEVIAHDSGEDKIIDVINKIIMTFVMIYANSKVLEEKQIENLVISMKRLGKNEELIEFINNAIEKNRAIGRNVILLENRARAKMDLAKICINTAKDDKLYKNPSTRHKAWESARHYLNEAERDLNGALENTSGFTEKESLKKDLEILEELKTIIQHPDEEHEA